VGATPVMSMLHSLAAEKSQREIWWIYGARNRVDHPFAEESRSLLKQLSRGRGYIVYSRPAAIDQVGADFNAPGHIDTALLERIGVSRDSDFYLCGPSSFLQNMRDAGTLGLPLMVAIIGGEPKRFRPLIDLYREAGRRAGHSAEKLIVGLHAIGFLGDTTRQAAEDFYPGCAHTFTEIGNERGWPPATRAPFDALRGPTSALLIGEVETVAQKVIYVDKVLGGLSRITFQIGISALPHDRMLRSIELLGTRIAPIVRKELRAVTSLF
jgi:hypothetical protein